MAKDYQIFQMLPNEDMRIGTAIAGEKWPILILPKSGMCEKWCVPQLKLHDGCLADFLTTNIAIDLFSERLRSIMAAHAGMADTLQWLQAEVITLERHFTYYALNFPEKPDLLDRDKTVFADKQKRSIRR